MSIEEKYEKLSRKIFRNYDESPQGRLDKIRRASPYYKMSEEQLVTETWQYEYK